jgi:hypothetical protein
MEKVTRIRLSNLSDIQDPAADNWDFGNGVDEYLVSVEFENADKASAPDPPAKPVPWL